MSNKHHRFELIETMRADSQGQIPLLVRHLQRLQTSALSLRFSWPGRIAVEQAIQTALLKMTTFTESTRVRLLMTPDGELQITTAPLPALQERPLITLAPLTLEEFGQVSGAECATECATHASDGLGWPRMASDGL